jgi:hypothetical protein
MSSPLPMPGNLGSIEPPKDFFFDGVIPRLRDLLPQFHGQPGYTYAQVCVQNSRRAQDEGWNEVANTAVYTIRGPKGEVHCKLYAMGRGIPGQSHASGKRICMVDDEVELVTGLEIQLSESDNAEIQVSKNEVQTSSGVPVEQREPVESKATGKTKT